ncbi:flagellar basal body-associated FliL family protein [Endozoicomonas ascidiicola]|uniref:flagellar basal body-associated FliL family protein n=1 Tax=Endozoicomonas ascidiicola TaxID=1698521 RepID=UPI0008346B23|nr:flagellar basal body-associated FliL family protein [Endozoicomonas ascidiicola]
MANEASKQGKKNVIIAILATVVVIGLSIATVGFFFGRPWQANASSYDQLQSRISVSEEPLYFSMKALVVNLVVTADSNSRFLKALPVIMTTDSDVIESLELYEPRLRSEMIGFLREQDPKIMLAANGFDELRGQMLALVRKVVTNDPASTSINDLYFTDFVVQ